MIRHWLAALLVLLPLAAMADEIKPKVPTHGPAIVVPQRKVMKAEADEPEIRLPISVTPVTPVAPTAVTTLSPDSFFVIEAQVECLVLASRQGFVKAVREAGPLRLRGHFADGVGVETRNYTAPILWIVEAVSAGEVELLVVKTGTTDENSVIRRTLIVSGVGPRPPPPAPPTPPGPIPPAPNPVDPPVPPPIPATGLRVLFVYEAQANMSREQLNVLHSTKVTAWMTENCTKDAKGLPGWRKFDRSSIEKTGLAKDDPTIAKLWEAVRPKLGTLPQIAIARGTAVELHQFPANETATIELLKGVK